jgi:uncharacterized protein YutE (UPF0331/DUF86 family)/predicted nucleotidyltransferase
MADSGLIEKLRNIFSRYPQVLAAYLYGSYSAGRQTSVSDIDIAVVSEDRGILLGLSADIARELNISEEKVSLTDLKFLDPALRLRIVKEGIEVANKGLNLNDILLANEEIVEVYDLEEAMCKSWLRGNPIDIRTVREIIARINEDLEDLEELFKLGYGEIMESKHLRKSMERTVQTLIESMLDLLRHIIAGLNLGVATFYKDYVDYAERAGIISSDTANEIRKFIPIRHILVHRYRTINYEEVWKTAGNLRITARKLVDETITRLKEKLRTSIS